MHVEPPALGQRLSLAEREELQRLGRDLEDLEEHLHPRLLGVRHDLHPRRFDIVYAVRCEKPELVHGRVLGVLQAVLEARHNLRGDVTIQRGPRLLRVSLPLASHSLLHHPQQRLPNHREILRLGAVLGVPLAQRLQVVGQRLHVLAQQPHRRRQDLGQLHRVRPHARALLQHRVVLEREQRDDLGSDLGQPHEDLRAGPPGALGLHHHPVGLDRRNAGGGEVAVAVDGGLGDGRHAFAYALGHRAVQRRPRGLDLGGPLRPQPLLQGPQQRLPDHRELGNVDIVLDVPLPEAVQHLHQGGRLDTEHLHSLAEELHHRERVRLEHGALLVVGVVLEREQREQLGREVEDLEEQRHADTLGVFLDERPRALDLLDSKFIELPVFVQCGLREGLGLPHPRRELHPHYVKQHPPALCHLLGEFCPKVVLERPHNRVQERGEVRLIHVVLGVPVPEPLDVVHERVQRAAEHPHHLADRLHHEERVRVQAPALRERLGLAEGEGPERLGRELEESHDKGHPHLFHVKLDHGPRPFDRLDKVGGEPLHLVVLDPGHHLPGDDVEVRFPRPGEIGIELLPKRAPEGVEKRLPDHREVRRDHRVLGVACAKPLEGVRELLHVLPEKRDALAHSGHHLEPMRSNLVALLQILVFAEGEEVQGAGRDLEDLDEQRHASLLGAGLDERPRALDLRDAEVC
mmetsp:Transcript_25652/g.81456  ORF Transcript_25652/g.81456 Transcript_25652/m.81456 type:complete len:689 (-) Transcript_25652:1268-3334(-)